MHTNGFCFPSTYNPRIEKVNGSIHELCARQCCSGEACGLSDAFLAIIEKYLGIRMEYRYINDDGADPRVERSASRNRKKRRGTAAAMDDDGENIHIARMPPKRQRKSSDMLSSQILFFQSLDTV
jgi:hypothetical protein